MKFAEDIIKRPVVTEKSMALAEENKYVFLVDPRANKTEIKEAVEKLFKVKVAKVRTMRRPGKLRRRGRIVGYSPEVKKAIVTLQPGNKIEIFEGV
ncbi:MAG: 50S ribosomal protein L23 [Peptococcaceae bacterium]|nr:50S ribosomal protein L23 [Peptococcaceae bacterium]